MISKKIHQCAVSEKIHLVSDFEVVLFINLHFNYDEWLRDYDRAKFRSLQFSFWKKILKNQNGLKRRKIDERQSEFWRSLEIPFNFMNYNNFKISRKAKQFTQVSINSKEFDWYVSKIPKWKCKYLKKGSLIDFFIIHFILPNIRATQKV